MKKKDIIHQETYYIAFEDLENIAQVYFFSRMAVYTASFIMPKISFCVSQMLE